MIRQWRHSRMEFKLPAYAQRIYRKLFMYRVSSSQSKFTSTGLSIYVFPNINRDYRVTVHSSSNQFQFLCLGACI